MRVSFVLRKLLRSIHQWMTRNVRPRRGNFWATSLATEIQQLDSRLLLSAGTFTVLPQYTLGGPAVSSRAEGISGSTIVGYVVGNTYKQAFIYDGTTNSYKSLPIDHRLGFVPPGDASAVSGNNVAIEAITGAFIYNGVSYIQVVPPGSLGVSIIGIDGNNVIGTAGLTNGLTSAFLFNMSTNSYAMLPEDAFTQEFLSAQAISGDLVVGYEDFGNGFGLSRDGLLYDMSTGAYSNFDPPRSAVPAYTIANGIDGNYIIGNYLDFNDNTYGFIYDMATGTYTTLIPPGTMASGGNVYVLSFANAVDANMVVGSFVDASGTYHGFIYNIATGSYTTVDPAGSTHTELSAVSGNNAVGFYTDSSGHDHAFEYTLPPLVGTTTALASSPNPSSVGQAVTLTASVTPSTSGQPVPTGTVTFMDGSTTLGTGTLHNTGTATFQTNMLAVGDHPAITAVYGGDTNFGGSTSAAIDQRVTPSASVISPSLQWDQQNGGVHLGYTVTNGVVPITTNVALYWASGNQFTDVIGRAISGATQVVPVGTAVGSYGPFHVDAAALEVPPPGATYLLAVADPSNQLGNFSDAQNVQALQLPTVNIEKIITTDSKSLTIKFDVENNGDQTGFPIDVYRSSAGQPNAGDQVLVADLSITGNDASNGKHTIVVNPLGSGGTYTFSDFQALRPDPVDLKTGDPGHEYVVVTADKNGMLNGGDVANPPSASFRIWLVGVIAHGYIYNGKYRSLFPSPSSPPPTAEWVDTMAGQLKSVDGYDVGIGFHWEATVDLQQPNTGFQAGQALATQVEQDVSKLTLGADDVVDVNFVGYSRGTVAISQALQDLQETNGQLEPQLAHGFMMETLVDPHPANNQFSSYSSASYSLSNFANWYKAGKFAVPVYETFQSIVADPNVVVPSNVQAAADYWQNTNAALFPSADDESVLNLWGESPVQINTTNSSTVLLSYPETAPGVGHAEMMYYGPGEAAGLGVYEQVIRGDQTLTALGLEPFQTEQATSSALSQTVATTPGTTPDTAATQLLVTTQPPSTVNANTAFGLVVQATDTAGTVDTSFNGSVTLALGGNVYGASLGGSLTVTAVSGVATFSGVTLEQGGTFTLSITSPGLAPTTTNSFTVNPAPATQLVAEGPNGNVLTGTPFGLNVYADDSFGRLDQTFNGSVALTLHNNSGGSLAGMLTTTAVNGVAMFTNVTLKNAGSGYTIEASSTGLTPGITQPFAVSADQLVVTTEPPPNIGTVAGFGLVVDAENGSGSVDTSFNGSVTVGLNNSYQGSGIALAGALSVNAVNGVATFTGLALNQSGYYDLTLGSDGVAGTVTGSFEVIAATATQLQVTTQGPPTVTANAPFEVEITAEDSYGNVAPTFNGNVTLALENNPTTGTLGGALTANAVAGVAVFPGLTISELGNGYTLQAIANGLTLATTSAINVTAPGVATQLVVTSQPPGDVDAGSTFGLVATAEDSFGSVDTSFTGSVTVNNSNGGAPLGQTTAVNGVATFSDLILDQVGNYSLTVTSNGLAPATTNPFDVNPLAATQLEVSGPFANVAPQSPFGLTVAAVDANNNVDPTFNGSVTLAIANNPGDSTLGGTVTATAVNGVAAFTGLTISNAGSGYTLRATVNGLTAGTTDPFDAASDELVTTQQPSSVVVGYPFGLVVSAEDGPGNVDASFNGSVTVALVNFGSNTPTLGGTLTVTAVNGIATFSGLTIDQPGNYALMATSSGLGGTATDPFNVDSPTVAFTGEYAIATAGGNTFSLASITQSGDQLTLVSGVNTATLTVVSTPGQLLAGGSVVAAYADSSITFSAGSFAGQTWTKLDLPDNYTNQGGAVVHIIQNGASLTFVNKLGQTSAGHWITPTQFMATDWGNEIGTLGNGIISWSVGVVWSENLALNGTENGSGTTSITATPSPIYVADYVNPGGKAVHLVQTGTNNVVVIDATGHMAQGTFINSTQFSTPYFPGQVATISGLGDTITWSGGTLWTQTARTSAITVTDYTNQFGVPVHLIQNGTSQLAFVDALGRTALGTLSGNTVQNPIFAAGVIGTLSANSIVWSNQYVWTQTNVVPLLIALTDAFGAVSHVQLTSATTLIGLDGAIKGLTATRQNDMLVWSNGDVWENFDFNALNALFEMATGYP